MERGGRDHEEGEETVQGLGRPDVHALRLQEGQIDIRKQGACPAGRRIGRGTATDTLITSSLKAGRGRNDSALAVYVMTGNVVDFNYLGSTPREAPSIKSVACIM